MSDREFEYRLFSGLIRDCYEFQEKNIEFLRGGSTPIGRVKRRLKDRILIFLRRNGLIRVAYDEIEKASEQLRRILKDIDRLKSTYSLLGDEESRNVLIEILKYRMLGAQRIRLPIDRKDYCRKRLHVNRDLVSQRRTSKCGTSYLNRYKLQANQNTIDLHCHPLGILYTFLLEQYAYKTVGRTIQAQPGDTVIDAGGCWGDTALYFADRVGPAGRVYCFEILAENLQILQRNLDLNKFSTERITVVSKALWNESDLLMPLDICGPGTSIANPRCQSNNFKVPTVSIDDFVVREQIDKVDFIKMDIEGAELEALRGAEKTLYTHKPKLAISVYHNYEDIFTIPEFLERLKLGYELFLDHFTMYGQETVLFANAKL